MTRLFHPIMSQKNPQSDISTYLIEDTDALLGYCLQCGCVGWSRYPVTLFEECTIWSEPCFPNRIFENPIFANLKRVSR